MQFLKTYWPFLLLAIYVVLVVYIRISLPDAKKLIEIIKNLYLSYGYGIVLLSGILEAMFLIGLYVPGSAAILLGAAVAATGVVKLPLIILLGTVGLMIGYTINYFMGKYGWYKALAQFGLEKGIDAAKEKLHKHGRKTLFLGMISPNSGSFLSTAAGALDMPFRTFFLSALLSQLFWSTVWGVTAYMFGVAFVELFLKYFMYIVWGLILLYLAKKIFIDKTFRWL